MTTPTKPTRSTGPHRPGPRPYPHPQPPRRNTPGAVLRAIVKAIASAAALAALLLGLPALLVAAAGWPLPHTVPTGQQVRDLLTAPGLSDALLLDVLACLGWLAWSALALSAVLELAAVALRVPAPRLPALRPAQALVGALIAALALAPLLPRTGAAPARDRPAATATATAPGGTVDLTGHVTLLVDGTAHTYPVKPGDTLWDISRDCLGDPHRWPEIYHFNAGHHFPRVGGALTDPDLIYPGWTLVLDVVARTPSWSEDSTSPDYPTAAETPPAQDAPTLEDPPAQDLPDLPDEDPTAPPTDAPAVAVPTTPEGTNATTGPVDTPTPAPRPAHAADDGLDLPGGWLPLPLAAAVALATTLAWNRRRRRYRTDAPADPAPGTDRPDDQDDDFAPLPGVVLAARQHVRRHAPDLQRHPDDVTARQAAQARRDGTPQPPPPLPRPDGPALTGLAGTTPAGGTALLGPGAHAAARALLIATLTAGRPDDGDAQGHVLVPTTDLKTLLHDPGRPSDTLPPTDRIPGLTVTDDLAAALTGLEAELIARRRLLLDADAADLDEYRQDPDHEPVPRTVLITAPPAPDHADRLAAAAGLGTGLGVTVVVLGPWTHGTTLTVSPDGHLDPAGTGTDRLAVLDPRATRDILDALALPAPAPEPASPVPAPAPPADDVPATTPAPTPTPAPGPAPAPAPAPADRTAPTTVPQAVNGKPHPPMPDPPAPPPDDATPSTGRVQALVLGTPAILLPDGTPVDSVREAALELLTYLAVHRDGAALTDIKGDLYGEATRDRATQRLSTDVANLRNRIRKCLGTDAETAAGDPVVNTGGRYHLNPDLLDLDWWRVQDATRAAKNAADPAERRTALETALASYTGPLADGRDYDWATRARERTRRLGIALHTQLALQIADTDPRHAAQLLDAACDLDPYHEDTAQLAMRAHARNGDTETVKTRMRRLRAALDELDEVPGEATEALVKNLTSGSRPAASRGPTGEAP